MNSYSSDTRIDAAVRSLVIGDVTPTEAELEMARSKLEAAIREERLGRKAGVRWRYAWAAGIAAVALVVTGAVLWARPAPLQAALADYAEILIQQDPLQPQAGGFIYQESHTTHLAVVDGSELPDLAAEQIAYLIVEDRQIWVGADNTIELAITPTSVEFFSDEAAAAYRQAGWAELDGIGVTTTVTQQRPPLFPDLPQTPDELERYLCEQARLDRGDLSEDERLFQLLAVILADPTIANSSKAAAAEVIGRVKGIELVERTDTQITVALEYTDLGHVKQTLTLDLTTPHVAEDTTELIDDLDELDIPAGTIIVETHYQPPIATPTKPSRQ
jgi:hypothetical protein